MDRRDFIKTIIATPVMAPLVLGSPSSADEELFLISSRPEAILPSLLEEIEIRKKTSRRSCAISRIHPREAALSHALRVSGWKAAPPGQKADLILSFRALEQPLPPSFTLVRSGRILDIRTDRIHSVWQEMNERHALSSCLTIATLQQGRLGRSPGKFVRIYHNGHVADELSLKKDRIRTYRTALGTVSVKIEKGSVRIPASSCRHKICCAVPPASFAADRIVCAPNHFLLEVQGPGSIDTIIG